MILYLLFLLLIIGVEESQTANMTEGEFGTGTMAPDNVTSSLRDEMRRIEDKLLSNQTNATIITDESENFQDQNIQPGNCQWHILDLSMTYCEERFHEDMKIISSEDMCQLESFAKYGKLSILRNNSVCFDTTVRFSLSHFPF